MSGWRSVSGSHEEAQKSLEKSEDCIKFADDVFNELYKIERDYMQKLTLWLEAKGKLFAQRKESFQDPGTCGFYKESTENLLKHVKGKIAQMDQLLSTLDIDVLLRLADVHKELKDDADTHKKYMRVTDQQVIDNDQERIEAKNDLERAKEKLEKGKDLTIGWESSTCEHENFRT